MNVIFQKKIVKLYNWMPNVFSIDDDILISRFDELCRDHDTTLDIEVTICTQANLKLSKKISALLCAPACLSLVK